jgi:thiol-disulfide isomerase/thioredoxin
VALLRASVTVVLVAVAAYAGVTPGEPLPDFRVDRLGGGGATIERKDLAGKVAVVDFWASWCLACRDALPALDALARRFDGRIAVLAVGVDRDRATAERFAAEHLPSPALSMAHDPTGRLLARLGAPGMPAVYVVDDEGVVRHVASGWTAEKRAAIEHEVETLLRAAAAGR